MGLELPMTSLAVLRISARPSIARATEDRLPITFRGLGSLEAAAPTDPPVLDDFFSLRRVVWILISYTEKSNPHTARAYPFTRIFNLRTRILNLSTSRADLHTSRAFLNAPSL